MKRSSIALVLAWLLAMPAAYAGDGEHHDHAAMKNGTAAPAAHDTAHPPSAAFTALDTDRNGQISRAELPKNHRLAPHFGMLDTDRSGSLSPAEFAKGDGM